MKFEVLKNETLYLKLHYSKSFIFLFAFFFEKIGKKKYFELGFITLKFVEDFFGK